MCSDSPDTSGMNAAALANTEIAKDALAWYKQVYAENAPAREKAADYAYKVADRQLASSELNDSISKDYWDYQTLVGNSPQWWQDRLFSADLFWIHDATGHPLA